MQWFVAVLAALMVGISKSGVAGLSALAVALFTYVLPSSKQASGLVLPLLIFADIIAVIVYRSHAQWRHLWKLFPATALGVVLGFFALGTISDRTARVLIGIFIVGLSALSAWRRSRSGGPADADVSVNGWLAALTGVLGGFITLIANAAGPLMAIYLLTMRMPKLQYVGTAAVFFLLLNVFKLPFMIQLGLITAQSVQFNVTLLPAVALGVWFGRWLVSRIDQQIFEKLVLILSALAGLLLLL